MKKKFITLLFVSTLTLAGCGSSGDASSDTATTATTSTTIEESSMDTSTESLGDVQVEKEIFDVTLTIPADYIGELSQADLDKAAEENGYESATLNDDGSVTYVMSKKQHKELVSGIVDNINSGLSEMIASEDYPNITNIENNSDFSEFTVTTTSTELDMNESFSPMIFSMYAAMYHAFNGTTIDNVHIDFINADSSEVISTFDSAETENDSSSDDTVSE